MNDYFMAEKLIVDHLKVEVPEVNGRVFTLSSVDQVSNEQQSTPALHVLHGGDILGKSGSGGQSQTFDQIWIVVVAVKHAKAQKSGELLREIAGPIIFKVLRALQGFQPNIYCEPMHRMEAAEPEYKSGFAFFPYAFTTKIVI
jgi:hypothetical protein